MAQFEMGVGVDESGQEDRCAIIDNLDQGSGLLQLLKGADFDNSALILEQRAALQGRATGSQQVFCSMDESHGSLIFGAGLRNGQRRGQSFDLF